MTDRALSYDPSAEILNGLRPVPKDVFEIYPYVKNSHGIEFKLLYEQVRSGEHSGCVVGGSGKELKFFSTLHNRHDPSLTLCSLDGRFLMQAEVSPNGHWLGFNLRTSVRDDLGSFPPERHPDFWAQKFVEFSLRLFQVLGYKIDELKGEWHEWSINHDMFWANYLENTDPVLAAKSTWSGKLYATLGYETVRIVRNDINKYGDKYVFAFFANKALKPPTVIGF